MRSKRVLDVIAGPLGHEKSWGIFLRKWIRYFALDLGSIVTSEKTYSGGQKSVLCADLISEIGLRASHDYSFAHPKYSIVLG